MDDADKATGERQSFSPEAIRESFLYATAAMEKFVAAVRQSKRNIARSR